MNTYDEGYLGEETSLYTRSKLEPDDKTKIFSEADKEKYLESLRAKYSKQKSLEEQYAEAKLVPEKDREHFYNEKEASILRAPEKFVNSNIGILTKMFNKSVSEIKSNPREYTYKYIQETSNKMFLTRTDMLNYQKELEKNIELEKDNNKRKELQKEKVWKMPKEFSIYHNAYLDQNGEIGIYIEPKNEKWVNEKGEEFIFDIKTGKVVRDGINDGTFNVGGKNRSILTFNLADVIVHFKTDVKDWENYGIGKDDILTKEQRKILSEMGEKYVSNFVFKNYINLKGGKLTESIYKDYLKLEEKYHNDF